MAFDFQSINKTLFLDKVIYPYSDTVRFFEVVIYATICFTIPMFLSHPQVLVGTIINAILILSAHYLKNHEVLPAVILPSVGVVAAGALLGELTPFVIYMIPFIWLGNASIIYMFKKYHVTHKKSYSSVLASSTIIKGGFLSLSVMIMVGLSVVPAALIIPFTIMQFATLILGGIVSKIVIGTRERILQR